MPQVDPKFTFWFGVWTNLLLFIAGYGVDHAPAVVAQYAPAVQWVAGMLGQANGVILTALVGISSTQAGPLVPTSSIKPIVILAVILSGLLAFPGDASAQVKKPQLTGDIVADTRANLGIGQPGSKLTGNAAVDVMAFLDGKFLPDLEYALKLATAANNTVTAPCYQAWIDIINTRQNAVKDKDGNPIPLPDPHLISDFERIVELRNALTPESQFMLKCSPVASMVKLDIAKFMGLVISGGAGLAALVPGL